MYGVGGDAVNRGTALQRGGSWVRFPMGSLTLYFRPWVRLSFLQKFVPGTFSGGEGGGKGGMCLGLTNLSSSSVDCIKIQCAPKPVSPKGLFSPVQG